MTDQQPDLKTLIRRLEKRHQQKQMATALVVATGLLAITTSVASVFYIQPEEQPLVAAHPLPVEAPADTFGSVSLEGKAAIVYDLTEDRVLYEKNARSQLPLASLTKLLTIYAAATSLESHSTVTITDSSLLPEGDSGFMVGERFAFNDLARIALVASSNDATAAIAETAAIARATTGKNLLAGAASALGLAQTYALNGTGLDESASVSGGYGSAKDIATLAGNLLEKAPEIAHATVEPSITIYSKDGVAHTLPNTNPDVVHIPNVLLSKTGFTDLAGGNLAVVYDSGINHPIAVVVLGSSRDGRFRDVDMLITKTNEYFANAGTK